MDLSVTWFTKRYAWIRSKRTSARISITLKYYALIYVHVCEGCECNNCFAIVPGSDRCLAFPFFKALLKSYILILLGMLLLKINIFFCCFLLRRHSKFHHLELLVLWKILSGFLHGH